MRKILSCLFCFIFFSYSFVGAEEPLGLYLTWRHNPQSSMNIQWITGKDDLNDAIEFQREGEGQWCKKSGKHMFMPSQQPFIIHSVELNDLQPAASYRFHLDKETSIYKFRTMPDHTNFPLRFVVGGDMYNGTLEMLEKTNRAAADKNHLMYSFAVTSLISATGDVYKPEDASKWLDWLKVWKKTMMTPIGT